MTRPGAPRDPGDAWVEGAGGVRYWGLFGAAGLLVVDPERGVLLQHRAQWSHHGGTWGIPGGALRQGETALPAALREAGEEAGVPAGAIRVRATSVVDLEVWRYTTVVADVTVAFDPVISDPESLELAWVGLDEVEARPLHPGFAASWPALRALLPVRPAIVVDAANVVGSVPDGWWRDRPGAAARLLERLGPAAGDGLGAAELALPAERWFPEWTVVVEGAARAVPDAAARDAGLALVRAPGSGDDAIAAEAARLVAGARATTVVTSDRGLAARAEAAGATVRSSGWLLRLLG